MSVRWKAVKIVASGWHWLGTLGGNGQVHRGCSPAETEWLPMSLQVHNPDGVKTPLPLTHTKTCIRRKFEMSWRRNLQPENHTSRALHGMGNVICKASSPHKPIHEESGAATPYHLVYAPKWPIATKWPSALYALPLAAHVPISGSARCESN